MIDLWMPPRPAIIIPGECDADWREPCNPAHMAMFPFATPMFGGRAPISFVSGAKNTQTSGTTFTIAAPSGLASGDLLIAYLGSNNTNISSWGLPSGWTSVESTTNPGFLVAYKVAGGSEPGSYSFTVTNNKYAGSIVAFRNAAYDTIGTLGATAQIAPGVTVSQSNSAVLAIYASINLNGVTWGAPTSYTIAQSAGGSLGPPSIAGFYQLNVAAGATGSITTSSESPTSGQQNNIAVSIKPA